MTPEQILRANYSPDSEDFDPTILLAMSEERTSPTAYGVKRPYAVAYLALHWLALAERGNAAAPGPITSETEGQLSRAYGMASNSDANNDLHSTSWGQQLIRLRRGTIGGSFMNARFCG